MRVEGSGEMFTSRLILAIVSTTLEEVALVVIWRWGLPQLGIKMPLYVLITVMTVWVVYAVTIFMIVTWTLKKKAIVGLPTMIGSRGKVASPLAPEGFVMIKSELWGAESIEGEMDTGEEVIVMGQDGLKLVVCRSSTEKSKGND